MSTTINNPKYVYFKASKDKTGKFCLGGQDLTHTGIKHDSKLLSSFNENNSAYSYYSDKETIRNDGTITPNYKNETLDGTYQTPGVIGSVDACPSLPSTNIIYNTLDVNCPSSGDGMFPGCDRSTNTCEYTQAPEQIWICDWSQGCIQLDSDAHEEEKKIFNKRINYPRAQAMYPDSPKGNPQLQTYTTESQCKKQCAGPYSRCNTNIEGEQAPGYPSWKLKEPIPYSNGYTATTQNWFYCDKNIHCHGYNDKDPCFCSLPSSIPSTITHNPNFSDKYDWQLLSDHNHQNGGAFDNLVTATPIQKYTHDDVQGPLNGYVNYDESDPEIVYESQNWFQVEPNWGDPTEDRPWLFTKSHNYWPNVCDFTKKEIKYQCGGSKDRLLSTGFCGSPGDKQKDNHRLGMMTGLGPINFYGYECRGNDLSSIQLPNYTNMLQIRDNTMKRFFLHPKIDGQDRGNWSGSWEVSPAKYPDKRFDIGAKFGQGAIALTGFDWDNRILNSDNLGTTIAPFNCVHTTPVYPVYDVG